MSCLRSAGLGWAGLGWAALEAVGDGGGPVRARPSAGRLSGGARRAAYPDRMEHIDETALPAPQDRVATASREVDAPAGVVFELIADPARQPEWDGNDNLAQAEPGQRVTAAGDVFVMTLRKGVDRANHVVEFEEGRRIAWKPSEVGGEPFGQLWRWEVEGIGDEPRCRVTHTYDWTELTDPGRIRRALRTGPEQLRASIDRLAELARTQPQA